MAVSLGINPITWTNDDMPELGGDIPLSTCLSETRMAGYAGIELGGKFPREPAVLRPILAEHGLRLVSGWYSAQLCRRSVAQEQDAVASHLDLLAAFVRPVTGEVISVWMINWGTALGAACFSAAGLAQLFERPAVPHPQSAPVGGDDSRTVPP